MTNKKIISQSKRLRNVLFLRWQREVAQPGLDFESWYFREMEKIIINQQNQL